jgi:two-component system cell cycle sensor histidine kinase/response regulator CckA
MVLNSAGYGVLEATDGQEAVDVCETHPAPIDLLISDVILSGSDGPAVAKRLKELRPTMRILFVSGLDEWELVNRGLLEAEELAHNQTCFLQKPFTPQVLREKVAELLGQDN